MNDSKSMYLKYANLLGYGNLTKISTGPERTKLINEIADKYCKASEEFDETTRSYAICGLMILFWGEIGKMADKCKGVDNYEYDDFVQHLYMCIQNACDYKGWKDGKLNAEQCIRQSIATRGAAYILYVSNHDKNKANINTTELDMVVGDNDDTICDSVADDSVNIASDSSVDMLIQDFIDEGKVIEGIVLDSIITSDTFKYSKITTENVKEDGTTEKKVKVKAEFWKYQLVKALTEISKEYTNYFLHKYQISKELYAVALDRINKSNNTKLYEFIDKALIVAKRRLAA